NLLLLLLRCLIPVLLALAVARPFLQSGGAPAAGSGTTHHVVVLDGSYSMGFQRDGGQSPFDRGRALIGRLLERLEARAQDNPKFSLVLAGVRPRFLVRGDMNLAAARNQCLLLQKPEDAGADLTEAMAQVAEYVDAATDPELQVYLLTDLQVHAFGKALQPAAKGAPAGPELQDTVRDAIERIGKKPNARFHLIDTGPLAEQHGGGVVDNVQITGLRLDEPAAVARVPITFIATLKNRGQTACSAQVTLDVDGAEPNRKVVNLEAGAEGEAEFQLAFRDTGRHRLHASLQSDGLEADDERFLSLDVRERLRVLLVDGAADEDPLRTNAYVWQSVLDPSHGQGGPEVSRFEVKVIEPLLLLGGQEQPAAYDITVLADVDRLNERAAVALQQALQAGKGVLVAFGDRADVAAYDLQLHAAGTGIMPFRLLRRAGPGPGGVACTPSIALPEHGALAEFDEPVYREVLQSIWVFNWLALDKDDLSKDAQVVLRLTDAERSPLLVAHTFGDGRVLFWLSGPASEYRPDRWNRFDDPVVAFHLLHGLCKWLALPAQDPFNTAVGSELACTLPARPENVEVTRPERDGSSKTPLSEEPKPLPGGRYLLPPFAHTDYAGFYSVDLQLDRDSGKEHQSLLFAVNVDPDEGELRYPAHDDVRQALGIARVLTTLPSDATGTVDPQNSELGPSLLLATLLFVLFEAAMARYVSVRRSPA
ncbi:MAG TPA: vWA domain-containing protein, partial [Planctomycetota bacterium]|nr:vWA domain-containing protein [Planctomycetota bacterium]